MGGSPAGVFQPHIDELQGEDVEEHFQQGLNNLRGLAATPDGRKREDADQIIRCSAEGA